MWIIWISIVVRFQHFEHHKFDSIDLHFIKVEEEIIERY